MHIFLRNICASKKPTFFQNFFECIKIKDFPVLQENLEKKVIRSKVVTKKQQTI